MRSSADVRLDELCRLAFSAAAAKGHELPGWTPDESADEHARCTTCSRCGRSLCVRVGDGITGMAGAALTQPCD